MGDGRIHLPVGRNLALLVVTAFVVAACATPKSRFTPLPVEDSSKLRALSQAVSHVRGIGLLELPSVLIEDDRAFARQTFPKTRRDVLWADAISLYRILAGTIAVQRERSTEASYSEAAYYNEEKNVVVVKRSNYEPLVTGNSFYFLMAHELEHVSQRTFLARRSKTESLDEAWAWQSMAEGDATLTVAALWALVTKQTLTYAMSYMSSFIKSYIGTENPNNHEESHRQFLYLGGARFLFEVYRHGGINKLNDTLLFPPKSTSQVLHPQDYLSEKRYRTEFDVPVPAGMTARSSDTFGEYLLGDLLWSCTPRERARELASGWKGDRFVILTHGRSRESLAWTIVWDSDESADRFASEIAKFHGCAFDESNAAVGLRSSRRGNVVAMTAGFTDQGIASVERNEMLDVAMSK